jgi:CP family cyanate transporter-like MFS transporter
VKVNSLRRDIKSGWPVYLIAINMRAPIIMIGPLLPILKVDFNLSTVSQSVLTGISVFAFSLMALVMHQVNRLGSTNQVLTLSAVLLSIGLFSRMVSGFYGLFIFSLVIGISIAVINFMLPVWVKENSAQGSGYITGIYAAIMGVCGSLAVAAAVPLAKLTHYSWRLSMAPATVLALGVALIWLFKFRETKTATEDVIKGQSILKHPLFKSPSAWAVALFFGCQSMMFYSTATWIPTILLTKGFTLSEAGVALASATFIGSIAGIFVPHLASMREDARPLLAAISLVCIGAFAAIALDSGPRIILWLILGNISLFISFPLSLLLCVTKSSSPEQTKYLSIMSQSIGYFLAAIAPLLMGVIFEITLNWDLTLVFIMVLGLIQLLSGFFAGKPGKIKF